MQKPDSEMSQLPAGRRLPLFRQAGVQRGGGDASKIVEDCRKFVASRAGTLRIADGTALDADRLVQMEAFLARKESAYTHGHFLSLVRLSLDLTETARTGVTAVEKRSLHLLERRLAEMQRSERPANPSWVASWISAIRSGDSLRQCALLDLMRYLDEVTGHPLVGFPDHAASDSIHLLLALHHFSARTARASNSALPLDVCLGARCILANSRVLHLRLGALLDQVLSPELPMWESLEDWMRAVEHDCVAIFRLPQDLLDPSFVLEGRRIEPLDLVLSVGDRLERPGRNFSVIESLVALERTLYRRIYRQESRKHHMAVLLRRVLDRALHEKNRRSMRLTTSASATAQILSPRELGADLPPWDDEVWVRLRDRGEALENARDQGYTPSTRRAWGMLFGELEPRGEELADLDEFLRWCLGGRGAIDEALASRTARELENIKDWYQAIAARAMAIEPRKFARTMSRRHVRDRTSPLLWIAAARRLRIRAVSPLRLLTGSVKKDLLAELDALVPTALEPWRALHPWDRRLFGIWPADLRGPGFVDGIRLGLRRSRTDGTLAHEAEVRLEMLERELEFRSWLGANERVSLLERTLEAV
jgi:hypothetical protein